MTMPPPTPRSEEMYNRSSNPPPAPRRCSPIAPSAASLPTCTSTPSTHGAVSTVPAGQPMFGEAASVPSGPMVPWTAAQQPTTRRSPARSSIACPLVRNARRSSCGATSEDRIASSVRSWIRPPRPTSTIRVRSTAISAASTTICSFGETSGEGRPRSLVDGASVSIRTPAAVRESTSDAVLLREARNRSVMSARRIGPLRCTRPMTRLRLARRTSAPDVPRTSGRLLDFGIMFRVKT